MYQTAKTRKVKPSIVFFGTGPVSLMCLEGIYNHFDIEAIVTKPDRIMHGKIHDHPVKYWGVEHGIPVHQFASKQELSEFFTNRPFKSQIGLVVDFGIIIPPDVIDYFPKGIVNSHFSLLPEWRGADPISFALLSGQPKTGVSLMLIAPGMDEGNLIAQETLNIPAKANIHDLTKSLSKLSNHMFLDVLPKYLKGNINPRPQDPSRPVTYSRKLTKEDGVIDWTKPAAQIEREIRTFLGWPGSRTILLDKEVIITKAHVASRAALIAAIEGAAPVGFDNKWQPGQTIMTKSGMLAVICGKEALIIDRLKPAGKKEMAAADFVRGLILPGSDPG